MATKALINGKYKQRAGVYSTVKSAIKNPSSQNSYSNVLIIDDGIGAGFGGGSAVNGQFKKGVDSVYSFDNVDAFQAFIKGGELWNLAKALFNPSGSQNGISKLFYIKAATTVPAIVSVDLTNGSFDLETKDEGVNANGVLAGGKLSSGIAGFLVKTPSAKYKFQLWHGTYKGLDAVNSTPYDGILAADAKPQLLIESPEVTLVADLISWFQSSADFNVGFNLKAGSAATGAITDADLVTYPSYILASGGTEVFNSADFDTALTKINNLDFVHILSMKYGANAISTNNDKLTDFNLHTSKYDRYLIVAGGFDKSERASSKAASAHFNSDEVIVVHGGVKKTARVVGGFKVFSQLYHAATVLGRCAGLPPQVPVTLKSIDVDGFVDPLEDDDQEELISAGVVHSYYDTELGGVYVVGLDVTSVQKNDFLINDDGTTYSWQLKRIEADLNKDIVISGKKRFFDPNGVGGNRNNTSPEEVTVWAQNKLKSRQATDKKDDLIVSYKNVAASINQDIISLTYDFVPNTEVKMLISTGTMIEG
jgi:hypothetical protein